MNNFLPRWSLSAESSSLRWKRPKKKEKTPGFPTISCFWRKTCKGCQRGAGEWSSRFLGLIYQNDIIILTVSWNDENSNIDATNYTCFNFLQEILTHIKCKLQNNIVYIIFRIFYPPPFSPLYFTLYFTLYWYFHCLATVYKLICIIYVMMYTFVQVKKLSYGY